MTNYINISVTQYGKLQIERVRCATSVCLPHIYIHGPNEQISNNVLLLLIVVFFGHNHVTG